MLARIYAEEGSNLGEDSGEAKKSQVARKMKKFSGLNKWQSSNQLQLTPQKTQIDSSLIGEIEESKEEI